MTQRIALILHPPFFDALVERIPGAGGLIPSNQLAAVTKNVPQTMRATGYAGNYLFGVQGYPGMIADYGGYGIMVDAVHQEYFRKNADILTGYYDGFDFLLSSRMPVDTVAPLIVSGKVATGWIPPTMSGKHYQYLSLDRQPSTRALLPRIMLCPQKGHLRALSPATVMQWFADAPYMIVKSVYGSRTRMPDGDDYTVVSRHAWKRFQSIALAKSAWFAGANGLILSGLIQTRDPYLGNRNAVVHKLHLLVGFEPQPEDSLELACYKMDGSVDLTQVDARGWCAYGEIFTLGGWAYGRLDNYRAQLQSLARQLFPLPCLFAVDLMIDPRGCLYYLESNKIAGTYLVSCEPPCPLARYVAAASRLFRQGAANGQAAFDLFMGRYKETTQKLNAFEKLG